MNPVHVHRFSIAGSKLVRLQVKDTAGNVDAREVALDVAFEPDPGAPGESHARFALPFEATDVVFDPRRPYAYATSKARKSLYFVNLDTGFIERAFAFAEMPERIAITPDGSKLYVALLTQEHSSYWWDEDQEGFVARFDLALRVKDRQFRVAIDPFDLAAANDGTLVLTSGSGQWTYIAAYDGDSGAARGQAARSIREQSAVELHPSGTRVYSAGGTSYPQDLHRWELVPSGIQYAWDSIYHGDHRVGDDLWISPTGDQIVTSGGDFYGANGTSRLTDLIYLRSLPGIAANSLRDLAWSPRRNEFAVIDATRVRVFDMTTHAERASFTLRGVGRFLGGRGPLLYAVQTIGQQSQIDVLVHGNRTPLALVSTAATVECEGVHGASVHLDGTGTSDPDSDPDFDDIVSYRWLREQSGAWTPVGEGGMLELDLPLGSHALRLEVKDRAGATGQADAQVQVVDTLPPEIAVTASPDVLAPANRRMVPVALDVAARDQCSGVAVRLLSVTSNAPRKPWKRVPAGALIRPDIEGASIGTDDRLVRLRAEHNTDRTHRVYTLRYGAWDDEGNHGGAEATVRVVEPRLWQWWSSLLSWLASLFGL
jgi:hypothetical protein